MYDLILVTVCINNLHINKLLDSIYLHNKHVKANVIIVNQSNSKLYIENNYFNNFKFINLNITDKNYLNSSSSRNIAFEYILKNKIKSNYICFPDDDTTFDNYFFEYLKNIISSGIYNNYIFDVYCNNTDNLFHNIKYEEGHIIRKYDYKYVGAVNILINFETWVKTGFFDTRFGVNAKYGAGEDGDYFLRALKIKKFYYTKKLYNFHPSKIDFSDSLNYNNYKLKLKNYGKGVIVLLIHHKMFAEAFKVSFKALAAFFYYSIKAKPKLAFIYLEVFFVRLYTFIFFLFNNI